ncbi:hypothetical protein V6C21_07940 [[Clostridium] cellulosi]
MEAVLSLPINAIALDNEEMEYVDGGYSISKISNGYLIRLSSRECGDLSALIAGGTSVTTAIATVYQSPVQQLLLVLLLDLDCGAHTCGYAQIIMGCTFLQIKVMFLLALLLLGNNSETGDLY